MARRFFQVTHAAIIVALILFGIPGVYHVCNAQDAAPQNTAAPSSSPADTSPRGPKHGERTFNRDALPSEEQNYYDGLSPEQQARFRENYPRWVKMSREERNQARASEARRNQMIAQEIEAAIKESGLQLDDKTRDEYIMRYTEERRKIEQQMQKERRELIQAMIAHLKEEFQNKSSPTPATSQSPAPQTSGTTSS